MLEVVKGGLSGILNLLIKSELKALGLIVRLGAGVGVGLGADFLRQQKHLGKLVFGQSLVETCWVFLRLPMPPGIPPTMPPRVPVRNSGSIDWDSEVAVWDFGFWGMFGTLSLKGLKYRVSPLELKVKSGSGLGFDSVEMERCSPWKWVSRSGFLGAVIGFGCLPEHSSIFRM